MASASRLLDLPWEAEFASGPTVALFADRRALRTSHVGTQRVPHDRMRCALACARYSWSIRARRKVSSHLATWASRLHRRIAGRQALRGSSGFGNGIDVNRPRLGQLLRLQDARPPQVMRWRPAPPGTPMRTRAGPPARPRAGLRPLPLSPSPARPDMATLPLRRRMRWRTWRQAYGYSCFSCRWRRAQHAAPEGTPSPSAAADGGGMTASCLLCDARRWRSIAHRNLSGIYACTVPALIFRQPFSAKFRASRAPIAAGDTDKPVPQPARPTRVSRRLSNCWPASRGVRHRKNEAAMAQSAAAYRYCFARVDDTPLCRHHARAPHGALACR